MWTIPFIVISSIIGLISFATKSIGTFFCFCFLFEFLFWFYNWGISWKVSLEFGYNDELFKY
jgi:hypothetical protein